MESKTMIDSNVVTNSFLTELIDTERIEKVFETELDSAELFKIDCAILSSLRSTQDFSRDLLKQLENGKFESITVRPPKATFETELQSIQQQTIMDIVSPLNIMFDEMADLVTAEFIK